MNFTALSKKISMTITAGICGISLTFSTLPMPNADASILGGVTGAVVSGNQAMDEALKPLKYYNNTEEGRQTYFEGMQQKYGINYDETLNSRLDTIMTNLTASIATVDPSIKEKPYNYFINRDESFNAFCTVGHNISVNTGAFTALANDEELAVVLAHEMGHGQKDHPFQGYKKTIKAAILGNVVIASTGGSALSQLGVGQLLDMGTTLQIDRPQEWEADNLAFDYITHSNYNPGACAAVWQRNYEQSGNTNNAGQDHAGNLQRRDNYVKKLYDYSKKHVTVKDGVVLVNGKAFTTPAPAGGMSSAERSYFVLGNLAAAYHNGHDKNAATVSDGGTVMLGAQPILTPADGDSSAADLAAQLNKIK